MSQNPTPPMEPLSVGNVVSAGLKIYRDHFKSYFAVAIRVTLWSFLPFLVLIPLPLFFIYGRPETSTFLLLIVIPIWLLLLLYCSAKSIVNSAIIGRLVFGELANQPETVREAYQILAPRMWTFLSAFFLLFLIGIGVWLGLSLLIAIIVGMIGGITNSFQENFIAIGIVAVIGIVIFVICLSFIIRLLTRFFIIDMPLAVEENMTATQTMGRSWELTKGYVGRIFLILIVAGLITVPISIIMQIVAGIFQGILATTVPSEPTDISFQLLSFIIGYIIGLCGNLLLLPFWQAIKAVIYYDLRTRREGMGLQLRKREI